MEGEQSPGELPVMRRPMRIDISVKAIIRVLAAIVVVWLWLRLWQWVLLLVVGWTILQGLLPGVRWALYGGISLDLLGSMPIGSHIVALLLCVAMIAVIVEPLERDQPMLILAVMLLATMVYGFTLMIILQLSSGPVPWQRYPLVVVVPTALINTIWSLPVFALLRRVHSRGQSASTIELF